MNASDLRIGNYVKGVRVGKVKTIFSTHFQVDDINSVSLGYSIQDKFEPIPLTEEWLIKFGFTKNFEEYSTKHLKIGKRVNKKGFYYGGREIKHVHQLQNLYFALTGEELTIK